MLHKFYKGLGGHVVCGWFIEMTTKPSPSTSIIMWVEASSTVKRQSTHTCVRDLLSFLVVKDVGCSSD